jgi:hypothetical protein
VAVHGAGDDAEKKKKSAMSADVVIGKGEELEQCIPRVWTYFMNAVLAGVCAAIGISTMMQLGAIEDDQDPSTRREKMRLIGASVTMMGVAAWPVAWDALVGYSIMSHHPLTIFGFVWPIAISLIDLNYASSAQNAVQAEKVFGIGEISSDAATLVGVAFAIGSLLTSQGNKPLADATVPLLMYALMLLIAFIVPTPSLDPNDYPGFAVGAAQRLLFNMAMGLVITAMGVNLTAQKGSGLRSALKRICRAQLADAADCPSCR